MGKTVEIRKRAMEHADIKDGADIKNVRPQIGADRAEEKIYEESKEKRDIASSYRTKIDKRK